MSALIKATLVDFAAWLLIFLSTIGSLHFEWMGSFYALFYTISATIAILAFAFMENVVKVLGTLIALLIFIILHIAVFFSSYVAIYIDRVSGFQCMVHLGSSCKKAPNILEFIDYYARNIMNQRATSDDFRKIAETFDGISDLVLNLIPVLACEGVLHFFGEISWIGYVCLFIYYIFFLFLGVLTLYLLYLGAKQM